MKKYHYFVSYVNSTLSMHNASISIGYVVYVFDQIVKTGDDLERLINAIKVTKGFHEISPINYKLMQIIEE